MIEGLLWTEKYRPTELGELALGVDTRKLLESYLEAGEVPHMLLVGPPGTGKTTIARIIMNTIDCTFLTLNASSDRGINVVRDRIRLFASADFGFKWNIVFLDEADALTPDAQTALRNTIEAHAERTRFILTANYGYRIIEPIQSRCQLITLDAPPLKERYRILAKVMEQEEITASPTLLLGYAERYPDLRTMLMAAQRAWLSGDGELPAASAMTHAQGVDILGFIERRNWLSLRRLTATDGFDPRQGLRDLFYAIPDNHEHVGFLRHIIGRGVHDSGFTPDPVVLFLAVCAECMEGIA